jgi:hypothetical protein
MWSRAIWFFIHSKSIGKRYRCKTIGHPRYASGSDICVNTGPGNRPAVMISVADDTGCLGRSVLISATIFKAASYHSIFSWYPISEQCIQFAVFA